jgi:hypothetical protein
VAVQIHFFRNVSWDLPNGHVYIVHVSTWESNQDCNRASLLSTLDADEIASISGFARELYK